MKSEPMGLTKLATSRVHIHIKDGFIITTQHNFEIVLFHLCIFSPLCKIFGKFSYLASTNFKDFMLNE